MEGRLLQHERIHLQQQLEMGILPFYIWYLTEYALKRRYRMHHHAYMALSHEQEAYAHDDESGYLTSRPFWAWLRFV